MNRMRTVANDGLSLEEQISVVRAWFFALPYHKPAVSRNKREGKFNGWDRIRKGSKRWNKVQSFYARHAEVVAATRRVEEQKA